MINWVKNGPPGQSKSILARILADFRKGWFTIIFDCESFTTPLNDRPYCIGTNLPSQRYATLSFPPVDGTTVISVPLKSMLVPPGPILTVAK